MKSLLTVTLVLGVTMLLAQESIVQKPSSASQTTGVYLGKTKAIRDLVPMNPTDPEKKKIIKSNRERPRNFVGRGRPLNPNPNALPKGPDPLRQTNFLRSSFPVEPLINMNGLTLGPPNDPTGDIGKNYYVQAVNVTSIAVFDKQGTLISTFAANTIWNQVNSSSAGDPIVLYDQEAERWIITEFPSGNAFLVAVSLTDDPLGEWNAYRFGTPNFPDYPKYGIWSNALSITTNEEGAATHVSYFINRQELLAGEEDVTMQRITFPGVPGFAGFVTPTPVDWTGDQRPLEDRPTVLSLSDDAWGTSAEDEILVHTYDINWNDPDSSEIETTSIRTSPFDTDPCSVFTGGFSCVPQPGAGGGLDAIPFVIMNQVHYRNFGSYEAMVMNFITDVTGGDDLSGIRWVELRREGGNDWQLYQEGTYAPDDGLDRYMGAICMDKNGNIGMTFNVSSEDVFAGVRFTGRRSNDPLGIMTVNEYILAEGDQSIFSASRFGDYAHMTVDPVNGSTFWSTTEYAGGNSTVTNIVAFELSRDTYDLGQTALLAPLSTDSLDSDETVSIEISNFGLDTMRRFHVGFAFQGNIVEIDTLMIDIAPDSNYVHTFSETVDMSEIGDYEIQAFNGSDLDEFLANDTAVYTVSHLAFYDVSLIGLERNDGNTCSDTAILLTTIANLGSRTIESLDIEIYENGTFVQTFNWTGSLAFSEAEVVPLEVVGLSEGNINVEARLVNPNGEADQDTSNNTFEIPLTIIEGRTEITLRILTDNFPLETTWTLFDEMGNEISTGGPYSESATLFEEVFCLDTALCYELRIDDSAGDGICCGFGEGNIEVVDAQGAAIAFSDGQFLNSETLEFCAAFMCLLTADVFVTDESSIDANDGAILIEESNTVGGASYSIDGGETFQSNPLFSNLDGGEYTVVVRDSAGCEYSEVVTVLECNVQANIEIEDASSADAEDGTISIDVIAGVPPYEYSIDGGETFQDSSFFSDLVSQAYDIVVRDSLSCVLEETVTVDFTIGTRNISFQDQVFLSPNPTDAMVNVRIKGVEHTSPQIPWILVDENGYHVQAGYVTRYNDEYVTQISLYNYPKGVYYLRFSHPDLRSLSRIIRQ